MQTLIINYGTLVAFSAYALDLLFQIRRVWRRKSSADISLWGFTARIMAAFILFGKYISLSDKYLVFGQTIVVILSGIYFILIVRYRPKAIIRKS